MRIDALTLGEEAAIRHAFRLVSDQVRIAEVHPEALAPQPPPGQARRRYRRRRAGGTAAPALRHRHETGMKSPAAWVRRRRPRPTPCSTKPGPTSPKPSRRLAGRRWSCMIPVLSSRALDHVIQARQSAAPPASASPPLLPPAAGRGGADRPPVRTGGGDDRGEKHARLAGGPDSGSSRFQATSSGRFRTFTPSWSG